jgi:hypothetical protein
MLGQIVIFAKAEIQTVLGRRRSRRGESELDSGSRFAWPE